jgi:hypothetical protein
VQFAVTLASIALAAFLAVQFFDLDVADLLDAAKPKK